MMTDDRFGKLEERVQSLEKTLFRLGTLATAVGVALFISLGITWHQVPKRALDALQGQPVLTAEKLAQDAAERANLAATTAETSAATAKKEALAVHQLLWNTNEDLSRWQAENLRVASLALRYPQKSPNSQRTWEQPRLEQRLPAIDPEEWELLGSWVSVESSGFVKNVRADAGKWHAGGVFNINHKLEPKGNAYFVILDPVILFDNGDHGGMNFRARFTGLFLRRADLGSSE